jgi:hypothetical protein
MSNLLGFCSLPDSLLHQYSLLVFLLTITFSSSVLSQGYFTTSFSSLSSRGATRGSDVEMSSLEEEDWNLGLSMVEGSEEEGLRSGSAAQPARM